MRLTPLLGALALGLATLPAAPLAAQGTAPVAEIAPGEALPGAFLQLPAGEGPFPVIILLGGSEGGDRGARGMAPRFRAEGYAVLGLPYYSPAYYGQDAQFPALPPAFDAIPVDKLEVARDWLAARPDIDAAHIGVYGVSKGAEFALLGGSLIDGFAAIVAIVPSDVVWEGWGVGTSPGRNSSFSWHGEPLPFVPYIGMEEEIAKYGKEGETPRLRLAHDKGRNANPGRVAAARIHVENIDEPVLVAGGDADNVWNSGEMAQYIAERRAAEGLPTVSLIFTDADHGLSGDGSNPNGSYSEADVEAQKAIWPATLKFFEENLKGG